MKKKRPGARGAVRRTSTRRPNAKTARPKGPPPQSKKNKKEAGALALLLTIGTRLVASTFTGLAIGYYTDRWLGTSPLFTLLLLVLGIAAGFYNMYRMAKRYGGSG